MRQIKRLNSSERLKKEAVRTQRYHGINRSEKKGTDQARLKDPGADASCGSLRQQRGGHTATEERRTDAAAV